MKILILGAGAVGGYWGARLTQAGIDTTFLLREKRAGKVRTEGLVVKSPKGDAVVPVKVVTNGSEGGPYDVVVLACKAYDLDSAMDSIAPAVGPPPPEIGAEPEHEPGERHRDRRKRRADGQRVYAHPAQRVEERRAPRTGDRDAPREPWGTGGGKGGSGWTYFPPGLRQTPGLTSTESTLRGRGASLVGTRSPQVAEEPLPACAPPR